MMAVDDKNSTNTQSLVRMVGIARGLEAGGYYNAAKLFWALAFSEEIGASNEAGLPRTAADLEQEMQWAMKTLPLLRDDEALSGVVGRAMEGVRQNRTIAATDVPSIHVCRNCGEVLLGGLAATCPVCGARALTFREFPAIYWLELYHPEDVLEALVGGLEELQEAMRGMTNEELETKPAPGEWSIREVLWHLLVAEGLLAGRVDKMLAEDDPVLDSLAAWTIGAEEDLSAQEILQRLRDSRLETLQRLKGIAVDEWWRTGRHEEFGQVTVLQQASYFAIHTLTHLPQIDETRKAVLG